MKYILTVLLLCSQMCFGQSLVSVEPRYSFGCLVLHPAGYVCDYYDQIGSIKLADVVYGTSITPQGTYLIDTIPEFKPGRYEKGDTVKVTSKGSLFVAVRTFNASAIPSDNSYWDYAGPITVAPSIEQRVKAVEDDVQRLKAANLLLSEAIAKIEDRLDSTPDPQPEPEPEPTPQPGNTVNFTLSTIPATEYLNAPGRGAEQWHNGSAAVGNLPQPLDVYYRFSWNQIEKDNGIYDWSYFDGLVRTAINRGQKLSFGIMAHRPESGDGRISYDGASAYYPLYLHKLMQAEPSTSRDWISNGYWVPNYNSPNYLSRRKALHQALRDHLLNTRYTATAGPNAGKSILLADAIYCIDIRGFGTWGEWHTSSGMSDWNAFPAGRQPTASTLKAIIDGHTQVFDRWPLVIMIAAYDAGSSQFPVFHPYPDVAYYALTAKNAWGEVGFRKDQWGSKEDYLKRIAELNNKSYNGVSLRDLIMNKWKTAPVTGEPMPGTAADLSDLVRQITLYHATSFGNGNYGATPNSTQAKYVEQAANAAGYRLQVKDGSITTGPNGSIKVTWQNVGITPTYENWDVVYELRSGSTVVWSGASKFKLKLFLPGTQTVTDTYTMIPTGNYTLHVKVVDPAGYRQPLPLANTGRASDGSYKLK